MADDTSAKEGKTAELFPGKHYAAAAPMQRKSAEDVFAEEFSGLKASVIRPVFESVGTRMAAQGHEFNISEEAMGKISIHIVPAGAVKSIHPFSWFPTFSLFAAPFAKTVGVHGRNARPNSEGSGQRGDYKLAQVTKEVVEKELAKFIGEIANWAPVPAR
jgi:hypothetical protein